ncbi:tRNA threonylcarbamoyladenosine biosynthesis protein TsaB, partial [Actinomyces sp. MRS3W]|uniref:tRNA threonylcarbamoyladenosine biosynthesis protein TsaB n=1 Tax=Actinomyces sp. MRS3W TaxID=2800796 RepID=UPI0028FD85BC|nr:tRNA (adenosine(37)-N6)-threonylcarbamoyltransferase complex dimerization subunit type 1 TsaB [Actinomyces sp. MRS3W]
VLVATDARRKEVYTACYRAQGADDVERVTDLEVLTPAALREREQTGMQPPADVVAGSGAALYPELAADRQLLSPVSGDAGTQVRIALARQRSGQTDALGTEPLYLRRPDIHMPSSRGPVR